MSKFALGRGELKKFVSVYSYVFRRKTAFRRKAALFILGIGFLILVPSISAQEEEILLEQEGAVQLPAEDDPLRSAERTLVFGEDTPVTGQVSGPSVWSVIRMILVLALVAAAIYGIAFLFKKASKPSANTDPYLKILSNAHLGANRYAHIISVGSRAWLVGSGESGVNLISEITDKEIVDAMLLDDSRKIEPPAGRFIDFMSILRRFGVKAQTKTPSVDDIRMRRERLKGL